MDIYKGVGLSPGIAHGRIHFHKRKDKDVHKAQAASAEAELRAFFASRERAEAELRRLCQRAEEAGDSLTMDMLRAHMAMLSDQEFEKEVRELIEDRHMGAASAVRQTAEGYAEKLAGSGDAFLRARRDDIMDMADLVIAAMEEGGEPSLETVGKDTVIVSRDIYPSEALRLLERGVSAFVTMSGTLDSHMAIISRSRGVPVISGISEAELESLASEDGHRAIVDGFEGELVTEPDRETEARYERLVSASAEEKERLRALRDRSLYTSSGRRVRLYANISDPKDVDGALDAGAEGIGLFRTELLYLSKGAFPDEEEQFEAYRAVAEAMAGRPVIIRTFDLGADKLLEADGRRMAEHPELEGLRGIQLCLRMPELLRIQLRAILRASAYGHIYVMYPMISELSELRAAKAIMEEARQELRQRGIEPERDVPQGIMIETPAAAVTSDLLAAESDFFSIGTNDLTAYTMARDRWQGGISGPAAGGDDGAGAGACPEAVLRLVRLTIRNAHAAGIWAGICGELAADPELLETFLDMDVDELSMSAGSILPIRKRFADLMEDEHERP